MLKPDEAAKHGFSTAFANSQTRSPKIGIGRTEALKVNIGGGRAIDYNGFSTQVQALSDRLASQPDTGTVSFTSGGTSRIKVPETWTGNKPFNWTFEHTGLVVFHGSNTGDYQSFTLDTDKMASEAKAKGYRAWGFSFTGIPANVPITVNVKGQNPKLIPTQEWLLNGTDVSVNTNDLIGDKKKFTDLAGRLMWNVHDSDSFTFADPADENPSSVTPTEGWLGGNSDDKNVTRWAMNIPGSIVSRRGKVTVEVDTNGRLYVAGDLDVESSEHHNAPYRFWNPEITVTGKTQATLAD